MNQSTRRSRTSRQPEASTFLFGDRCVATMFRADRQVRPPHFARIFRSASLAKPFLHSLILALVAVSVCMEGRERPSTPCVVSEPTATFTISRASAPRELTTDPESPTWRHARSAVVVRDCTRTLDYPDLKTEVRGFWTDTDLYFLFISPYRSLNVFLP